MTRLRLFSVFVLMLLFAGSTTQAQERQRHEGFWIGFGLGAGVNTAEELDDGQRGGGAAFLRLGGTLSQNILMGGEVSIWGRQEDTPLGDDTMTLTRSNATFTVLIFPSDNGGFFLKGGLGGANVETQVGNVKVTEQGVGTTIGLGFDVRLGSNLYLTPNLDLLLQTFEQADDEMVTNSLILLTLGLTWH